MAKYKIIPSSRTIVQSPISIGHKAEKGVEAIEFDVTAWVETYGSGTLTVIMRRWGDAIPYPIALEIDENNKATWTLSDIDTAKAGMAYAQLSYIVGETVVKKSDIYTFRVMDSLTGEGEPPEAYESWLEHLTHFAAEAMAEVLDIEGIVTDKTLTVDGGIADGKATGDALALKADKSTTYTKTEVDQMIEDVEVETDTTLEIAGAPADAAETGRQIGLLRADLADAYANGSTPFADMLEDIDTINSGISYSLSGNTLSCDGTSDSTSQFVWFGTTSSKPPYWFVGGEKYIISIDSTNDSVDVRFQIKRTSNTSLHSLAVYSQSGKYILDVPEDITVLRVVSMVSSGKTLNNDTLTLNIERVLNVKSEISELRSGLRVLGIKNDLTWSDGSYKAEDGTISTTVQYGNRYCNIIDAATFNKLTITPFLGRQICLAFFDRVTGAFIRRSDYTTESVTIDNTYSVGINLATTYTDRTISTEDLLSLVEIYRSISLSKWTGRKVAFIGDSITHGSYAPKPYHAVLNDMIGFSDMYVDGVAGSAYSVTATGNYTPISQRWQNIPTDRDLVVIFAGTNDWGHDAPIGTPTDTTDVSMCGALSVVINGVLTANPNARLVLITPLHRWGYTNSSYPNDTDNNGQGHPLADYVDAIKDMAQTYSIPVIDLFSDSGLNPRIPAISTAFFQDGLHPINAGHARLARQIASELEVLNFSGSGIKANLEAKYSQLQADLGDKSNLETLDKTNLVSAINSLNDIVRVIANRDTSWAGIKENVKSGYGEILYPVGTDFSVSCPSGAPYNDIVFTVVNHRVENNEPIMTLLMKRCIYGIQFDAIQAAFVASEAMAAGTYHFKLLDNYDTEYDGGKYVQFTIVNPLVAGDQIVITWAYNQSWIGKNAYVYHAFDVTPAETCVMSEGQGGTYLGVADGSSANLNHTHRLRYGSNNWKESAVREWLNSDAQAGSWQTQQTKFQRPCSYASSKAGFMSYLDPSFVAAVRTGTHLNRTNQVFDLLGTKVAYSTEERFFLLSNEEIGFSSESGIVCGSLFSFYDGANNDDRIKYDIVNENTVRIWGLRTPGTSIASYERIVFSSGALSGSYASYGNGAAAACEI